MLDDMYSEDLEELKDELAKASETMEGLVLGLKNRSHYVKTSDTLFRIFHNIKELSKYSHTNSIYKTAKIVEEILAILRHKKPPVPAELLDWLLLVKDFISDWSNEFELENYDVEAIDSFTLNMVQSSLSTIPKDEDILNKLHVTFMHNNKTCISRFNDAIKPFSQELEIFKSIKDLNSFLVKNKTDILVLPMHMNKSNMFMLVEKVSKKFPNLPIVLVRDEKLSEEDLKKFSIFQPQMEKALMI